MMMMMVIVVVVVVLVGVDVGVGRESQIREECIVLYCVVLCVCSVLSFV